MNSLCTCGNFQCSYKHVRPVGGDKSTSIMPKHQKQIFRACVSLILRTLFIHLFISIWFFFFTFFSFNTFLTDDLVVSGTCSLHKTATDTHDSSWWCQCFPNAGFNMSALTQRKKRKSPHTAAKMPACVWVRGQNEEEIIRFLKKKKICT